MVPGDVVTVVDGDDGELGPAAIVRVTSSWVIAVAAMREPPFETYLRWGSERVPARVQALGEFIVLRAARGGREWHPLSPSPEVREGEEVRAWGPPGGPARASAESVGKTAIVLDEVNDPRAWLGAVVTRSSGELVGFVTRAAEVSAEGRVGKPRVLRLDAVLERLLPTLLEAEGADSLSPGDGFVALELEVQAQGSLDALKALPDSWGEADPYLAVDRGLQALTRFRLDRETAPVLVTLPSLDPLRARLVERDVSIADGITEEDLAPELVLDPSRPASLLSFQLDMGGSLGVAAKVRRIDPDRSSGSDRTLLGASELRMRRVASQSVDLRGGDATDLWRVRVDEGGELIVLFYVTDPRAGVGLEGWRPGEPRARWQIQSRGRRLQALRVPQEGASELLLRVRQSEPGLRPVPYSVLVHPLATDPRDLVRSLFRLVGAEATRHRSLYLSSPSFALEVYRVFSEQARLDPGALAQALLGQLGSRVSAARHLALHLLELYVPAPLEELEAARREGGRRATDAGLLLALRTRTVRRYLPVWRAGEAAYARAEDAVSDEALDPDEEEEEERGQAGESAEEKDAGLPAWSSLSPSAREDAMWATEDVLTKSVVDAAGDPDPLIRQRAVATAARLEQQLRTRLRLRLEALLSRDPSRAVRRALLTAFPPTVR